MKVVNPDFDSTTDSRIAAAAAGLRSFFSDNPDLEAVSLDQVRQMLDLTADELPDGFIVQAAQDEGFRVIE